MEYLKKNYQIITIKLAILALFIWMLYFGYNDFYAWSDFGIVNPYNESIFQNYQFLNVIDRHFRPALFMLIPTVGIFINNQIGWLVVTSFIYFLISIFVFSLMASDLTFTIDYLDVLICVGIFIILLLLLIGMCIEKVRNGVYNIPKKDLIIKNIIANIIGMGVAIVLIYLKK